MSQCTASCARTSWWTAEVQAANKRTEERLNWCQTLEAHGQQRQPSSHTLKIPQWKPEITWWEWPWCGVEGHQKVDVGGEGWEGALAQMWDEQEGCAEEMWCEGMGRCLKCSKVGQGLPTKPKALVKEATPDGIKERLERLEEDLKDTDSSSDEKEWLCHEAVSFGG